MPRPPSAVFKNPLAVGLICATLMAPVTGQSGATPVSDIFFLDLGIVIEPVTGKEQYSRLVESPSDEVKFRINKIKSGAVYMATSKEMINTLDRINLRIAALEQSFQVEMSRLQRENEELRGILNELRDAQSAPLAATAGTPTPLAAVVEEPPVQSVPPSVPPVKTTAPVATAPAPRPQFDQAGYMSGVFAYQREEFAAALEHFQHLNLTDASLRTQANIWYWMADSYLHLGNSTEALQMLDRILAAGSNDRSDDALIQKGLLYRKLGQEEQALDIFKTLVAEHPASEYVKLARLELKKAEMVP